MFAVEAALPAMTTEIEQMAAHLEGALPIDKEQRSAFQRRADDILHSLPTRHYKSFAVCVAYQKFLRTMHADALQTPQFQENVIGKALILDSLSHLSPCMTTVNGFAVIALELSQIGTSHALELAKQHAQHSLRMRLICVGRDTPTELRKVVRDVLDLLPSQASPPLTECAFCGETPECAAITLTPCGKCQQVAYCSEMCKGMHRKVHNRAC
jgi:hypothetical protein